MKPLITLVLFQRALHGICLFIYLFERIILFFSCYQCVTVTVPQNLGNWIISDCNVEKQKGEKLYPFDGLIRRVHSEMPTCLKALKSWWNTKTHQGLKDKRTTCILWTDVSPLFYNPLIFTYRVKWWNLELMHRHWQAEIAKSSSQSISDAKKKKTAKVCLLFLFRFLDIYLFSFS